MEGDPNWPCRSILRLAKVLGEPLRSSSFRLVLIVGLLPADATFCPGPLGFTTGGVAVAWAGFFSSSTADTFLWTGLALADLASSSFLKSISVVLLWPMRSAQVLRRSGASSVQLRDGCFMGGSCVFSESRSPSPLLVGVEVRKAPERFLGTIGDMLLLLPSAAVAAAAATGRGSRSARRMGVA